MDASQATSRTTRALNPETLRVLNNELSPLIGECYELAQERNLDLHGMLIGYRMVGRARLSEEALALVVGREHELDAQLPRSAMPLKAASFQGRVLNHRYVSGRDSIRR